MLCWSFLIALTREEKLERAQAARALPFPFGRKRKQKGPFCTALRQRKDRDTLKAVRRTFPNSTIHIVSNTWEGSFLLLPCAAGAKIPSRATQKDSAGAASASRQRPAAHQDANYETDQKPCFFVHFFLFLDVIDKQCRLSFKERRYCENRLYLYFGLA